MAEFETVLETPELGPGEMHEADVHDRLVLVVNVGQTYYAVDALCPVDETPFIEEGTLDGALLHCTTHQNTFDVRTGLASGENNATRLRRHAIHIEGNQIQIGAPLEDEHNA